MNYTWNDGHFDRIGESIAGLTAIILVLAIITWPLALGQPKKGSGGCCNAQQQIDYPNPIKK